MRFLETFAMMGVVAGVASYATYLFAERSLDARLEAFAANRPPIAVIDYSAVYDALKAGRPHSELDAEFKRIGAAGDRLAGAGYLVFTSAQVVKVPEGSMIAAKPPEAPTIEVTIPQRPLDLGTVVDGLVENQGSLQ